MNFINISNWFSELTFDMDNGLVNELILSDGIKSNRVITKSIYPCDIEGLACINAMITSHSPGCKKIEAQYVSDNHMVNVFYEFYTSGYIVCTFSIETLKDNSLGNFRVGLSLKKATVFSNNYYIKNMDPGEKRKYHRATSVVFSTDDRPVTNSIDFMLESVGDGEKIKIDEDDSFFIGWEIHEEALSKKGGTYSNRWCLHYSSLNGRPNKVRGQRIYHWNSHYPSLPPLEMIEEMAEYGCSILILHMPSFKWIDGSKPLDEKEFKNVIDKAHSLGIKMMFYIQPILISQASEKHKELERQLNDNGKLCWHSLKNTQIVFYVPNSNYDCDELCLRCEEAYEYIRNSVLKCYKKYDFDGLYIDFAWPSIAVCNDENHNHKPGLFNFYDYLRMMREFREEIGSDGIMIGHGGSLLVSSDYAEGFDACLTGEGQKDLLPDVIGVQTGAAPTLWTLHRRKERQFRSREAMSALIREGITPHIGLGVLGKSIRATMDPAHTPHFVALWQIWRSFPVERSAFYNYLTKKVLTIDNDEITYSMYMTSEKQILLIICNGGGKISESAVSVEVNIQLDIEKLDIPKRMNCWKLKGSTYETFRIYRTNDVSNGHIRIPEIGIDEFIGIILTDREPPEELIKLQGHLEGRFERLAQIYTNRIERMIETDIKIDEFNKLDVKTMTEEEFMKDRTME